MTNKTILVAITDIFFYTKVRDALKPQGYILERAKSTDDVTIKAETLKPAMILLNLNDDVVDSFKFLEGRQHHQQLNTIPTLAFANHEEVDNWNKAKQLGISKVVSRNEFSARTLALVQELTGVA